ncbi:zinc finger protein 93-like [Plodia interpunctella]|uniref:zinc finger protein 93-like n=1 Tax=Plodia interpunctella TaxID=58824 RepID=UPI002368E77A|nr:zinc finger protein 93-like [Plodia interpunctella]
MIKKNNMTKPFHENNCRVCLSSDKMLNNKGVSLFEKYKDSIISEYINIITNVEVKKNDGLPQKICPDCLLELEAAVNFKQKCETSNSILHGNNRQRNYDVKLEIYTHDIKKEQDELHEPIEEEYLEDEFDDDINDATIDNTERPSGSINFNLICDDCGNKFPSKCKLRVHWKRVHLHEKLICQICKRAFKSYKAYNRHLKSNLRSCVRMKYVNIQGTGKSRLYLCRDCPYTSKRNKDIQSHLLTHTGEKPFKCPLCPLQYSQVGSLHSHMEGAHGKIKVEITCHYCGKIVKGRAKAYKHLKDHQKVQVQCDICKKLFKCKSILQNHMVRHTGVKSFTCEKCAQTYYTLAELITHKRTKHSNYESWYKCAFCDYRSKKSTPVKKHQAKHTDNNVSCKFCGVFFDTAEKLAQHAPRHLDSEKKNQCPHCERRFYKKDSIRRHIKLKHTIKNEREDIVDISTTKVKYKNKNLS